MSENPPSCVLLADRHHGLPEGVRGLLETAFGTVVMVADEVSLLEGAGRLRPDVAVVEPRAGADRGGRAIRLDPRTITRLVRLLCRYLPILTWGGEYSRRTFTSGLIVAEIVTVMLIPRSLAYALLAGWRRRSSARNDSGSRKEDHVPPRR
jgi:hypothetical protein